MYFERRKSFFPSSALPTTAKMQFPATTELFHVLLKSFFVSASLISDYTLKFDEWIVTRPDFKDDPSAERKRWIAVLKTSLTYAVLEPLCYALMTSVSNSSFLCLLMACLIHIHAIPGAIIIMGQCMLDVLKKHKEICGDTQGLAKEEEGKANEHDEKLDSELPNSILEVENKRPLPKVDLRPCLDRHPLPKLHYLAPLLPVATAALANAGLLYYTRYLKTEDSQTWYDRFAFGWFAIALCCTCVLIISRWNNKMMHEACGRPLYLKTVPWDVLKYRLVALFLMAFVRAQVRTLLSQEPLTWFGFSENGGLYLLGNVDTSDGPGTSLDNKKHLLDRLLAAIPPWANMAISIGNIVFVLGLLSYTWWRKRQQRRAEQTGEQRED